MVRKLVHTCNLCNKNYKHSSSLCAHKKKCKPLPLENSEPEMKMLTSLMLNLFILGTIRIFPPRRARLFCAAVLSESGIWTTYNRSRHCASCRRN